MPSTLAARSCSRRPRRGSCENLHRFFARELALHGSRLYTRGAWEEAIRLGASGAVPLAPLVSRKIPLASLQEGMETALGGGPVMKVLVDVTA
jgi:threonine dehydrogenase-like Zn-dependent dehydrogenase